jgi:16S rRNA (cytosine1402-N4)-methyltransferase
LVFSIYVTLIENIPMRTTPEGDHLPVLANEILDLICPSPGKIIVDATLGAGGHTALMLPKVSPGGKVLGIDLDPLAPSRIRDKLGDYSDSFSFIHGNFAGLDRLLMEKDILHIDGLIADLGVSSPQIDDPERGFSYVRPGPLDMRMDQTKGQTLAQILEKTDVATLAEKLAEFGDVEKADIIAKDIKDNFDANMIRNTFDLSLVVGKYSSKKSNWTTFARGQVKPANILAQVFQALRILVNRELDNLKSLLRILPFILSPGATVAFISFHSGEDRLIKKTFANLLDQGIFHEISKDPIRPTEEEKFLNPRSRSAKLRWARKTT